MSERSEPATSVGTSHVETEVGSVFVSNYPPYSFWSEERAQGALDALQQPPRPDTPLGLYLHIPFCRRRCKFCYFKVYTDKNSSEIERYVEAVAAEAERAAKLPAVAGRPVKFVYFGGGTPSYLSTKHLRMLVDRVRRAIPWDGIEEVAFEAEPGTLTEPKLATIREVGVTRLSLGVEHFDDEILRENGRAHVSKEIDRVIPWVRAAGFEQWNLDLIAGMVGDTDATWARAVERTIEASPDSVTIYQMELPFNTVYSKQKLEGGGPHIADWQTKRRWHDEAFRRLEQAGYELSSAYTMVKKGGNGRFVYRNSVWQGCDLLPLGVSSFGHMNGVHYQNISRWDEYLRRIEAGEAAVDRAYETSESERLTRELILQLKLGRISAAPFQQKFGVSILETFAGAFDKLKADGMLEIEGDEIRLTRTGLLRVDQLLPAFYAEAHQNARYT